LERRREWLAERGFLYPQTDGGPSPRHQWMVRALLGPDEETLHRQLNDAIDRATSKFHTIVLSSEGVFNHWWDFSREGRRALRRLSERFEVEIWVWFREPISFARSLYVQMLRNPPMPEVPCYGSTATLEQMLKDSWFCKHLDYIGFIKDANELLAAGRVVPYAYTGDTVAEFFNALGLPSPPVRLNENRSLGALAADLLRVLNQHTLTREERENAIMLISQIDAGVSSHPLFLTRETESTILSMTAESVSALQAEYGLSWRRATA
jgi:hypothetical protein